MADLASSVIYGYLQVNDSITANNLITAPKLTLTQATGTAPMTITSTTLVSNLNADLLDGKHASDFSLGEHNHTLDSLSNVTITSNATGEILKWNGTAWINNTLAEAGISATGHTHSYVPTTTTVTAGNGMTGGGALSGNITLTMGTPGDITSTSTNGVTATSHTHAVTSIDATKLTGTIADARLSGTYSGFTHKIDGSNTVYTTSSSGSSSALARTVYGLAEYRSASSAQVGAIVFIAPNTTSSIMYQFEIAGMLYNQHIVSTQVQGYRTTGAWSALKKCSTGTVDVMVRFGVTPDGKNCLILGDVATSWSYPHLSIIRAMFSHTGAGDAHCTGWTTAVVTDLSTYTNVTSVIADSAMVGSITGNAATATKLATTRALTIGSTAKNFDGSAAVTWSLAEIGAAASSHTHTIADVTNLQTTLDGKAASSHTHSYLALAGGTMTGVLTAQNNTSYTTKQVRNITLSTADPSGGANGDVWIKYTA